MDGRCGTCRWWGVGTYLLAGPNCCTHEKLAGSNSEVPRDGAQAGEGCARVYAGEQFGCIHWEAKE